MTFEPKDSICSAMLLFRPVIMETMAMTVVTPTKTPRTVRKARILWALIAAIAINMLSLISKMFILF